MTSPQEPHQQRANVVTMPPRPAPPAVDRKPSPASPDHVELPDEPGYGHGV
jgi:hypothetical protein